MNKSNIGNNLLILAGIFCLGFFLGLYSNKQELKGDGERPLKELHESTKKEESKIDSLNLDIVKIDSRINKHKETKKKNYEEYKEDSTIISNTSFDSLVVLFTRAYPPN